MNRWIFAAGILSALTLLIHLIVGEIGFHTPALQSNLATEEKAVLSVVWHGVSFVIALNTLALLWAAKTTRTQKPLVWLIVLQYMAFAGIFIIYGLLRLGSIYPMPQWTIFILMLVLALIGLAQTPSKTNGGTER